MEQKCPDEETLAAYMEGLLPEDQRSRIEAHISSCNRCFEEFEMTTGMVRGGPLSDAEKAPLEVTQSALRLVNSQNAMPGSLFVGKIRHSLSILNDRLLRLVRLSMRADWQLAPIRGSKGALSQGLFRIKKSFKDFDTDVEIEKTGENKAHIRISISAQNGSWKGIRATLKRGNRELCSALFSHGSVSFEEISFGPCKLTFEKDGVSLGVYSFHIKETVHGKK